jgi:GDP-L-fucose synthase
MNKGAKVYVAGHRGLVGSALLRRLAAGGFENVVTRTHSELDLTRQAEVEAFFAAEKPEYVFLAAARAGGIGANTTLQAEFISDNIAIEMNVIRAAAENGVKKLLFIASSSVYPKDAPQPMKETSLLTGELEPSNAPYALAKILGIKLCEYFNEQLDADFISVTPTNLYGYGDKYDPEHSHVMPALIRKFSEAVECGANEITVWGSGNARREFLHADDMADACVFLMDVYNGNEPVNLGSGTDVTIRELCGLLKSVSGFAGELIWDTSRPEGIQRRALDSSKLFNMGWDSKILLEQGIQEVYMNYHKAEKSRYPPPPP